MTDDEYDFTKCVRCGCSISDASWTVGTSEAADACYCYDCLDIVMVKREELRRQQEGNG